MYGCKDLSRRFPDIVSIDRVDPELLAGAISAAIGEAEERRVGKIVPRRPAHDLSADATRLYSAKRIAALIRGDLSARNDLIQ
jgi:hypothetical protein